MRSLSAYTVVVNIALHLLTFSLGAIEALAEAVGSPEPR